MMLHVPITVARCSCGNMATTFSESCGLASDLPVFALVLLD